MSNRTQIIIEDALSLPPIERAAIAERMLTSLDQPDPAIDELWAKEADRRIAAYRTGKIEAVDAEDVFAELNDL